MDNGSTRNLRHSRKTTARIYVTSTPKEADKIICIEDKTIRSHQSKEQMVDTPSPPPTSQTTPAAEAPDNNEDTTKCPPSLPQDLDVIKEFNHHDKDDNYNPLMSAIALKKKKRWLFLPVEFTNVKIDALVDSSTYTNAISERDVEKNQTHCQPMRHKQGSASPFQRPIC